MVQEQTYEHAICSLIDLSQAYLRNMNFGFDTSGVPLEDYLSKVSGVSARSTST